MTRFGSSFALASAVLFYSELAAATPAPTNRPTNQPTNAPTNKPTIAPTAYLGSGKWYADVSPRLCSKDCATGTAPDCTGINHATNSWLQDTFTSATLCCANKFSYLDSDYCTDRSEANPAGTQKYYADIATSSCKQDNSASLGPFQAGTLHATAALCCAGSLGWIKKEYCETRSSAGTYTNQWYVDYSSMVCKQDCAVAGTSPMCKPMTDSSSSVTLFSSALNCCNGKLGWIPSATCEAVSTTGVAAAAVATNKYYADYSASPARCAKDCSTAGDPECGGLLSNVAGVQMFDTAAQCCAGKFSWMSSALCTSLTTGTHTSKWYVDYQSNSCKQDCATSSSGPCGGSPPDLSMPLFDSAATCCTTKLGWVNAATCTSVSTSGTASSPTGTLKYYVDYSAGTCKQDCVAASTSPSCGGVLASTVGVDLFADVAGCCAAKYGWVDKGLCAAISGGTYTSKFYVDYADNACKQDCAPASGTNCGGHPSDLSIQLFSTAATCCSSKLSYLNQASCTSKSTSGSAAAATGTSKWYVDWSISKCVKDCPTSASDTQCGGLAESWESAEYSSSTTCCQARLPWVKLADCHT